MKDLCTFILLVFLFFFCLLFICIVSQHHNSRVVPKEHSILVGILVHIIDAVWIANQYLFIGQGDLSIEANFVHFDRCPLLTWRYFFMWRIHLHPSATHVCVKTFIIVIQWATVPCVFHIFSQLHDKKGKKSHFFNP